MSSCWPKWYFHWRDVATHVKNSRIIYSYYQSLNHQETWGVNELSKYRLVTSLWNNFRADCNRRQQREFKQKQYEIVMTWWILSQISINLRQMDHDWGDDLAERYLIKSDRVGASSSASQKISWPFIFNFCWYVQKVGELMERKPLLCLGEFEYSPSGYYVSLTPAFLSKVLTVKPNTDLDLAKSLLCYPSSQAKVQCTMGYLEGSSPRIRVHIADWDQMWAGDSRQR